MKRIIFWTTIPVGVSGKSKYRDLVLAQVFAFGSITLGGKKKGFFKKQNFSVSQTGGHSTFFGLLNTFVHIIMYAYYLLAALGPEIQKYLWWKKYLTSLQMVQFLAIMVHAFQLLFIDCDYPKAFVWWIGMHAVMFFFLFKEFYKQQYTKPSKQKVGLYTNRPTSSFLKKNFFYYYYLSPF